MFNSFLPSGCNIHHMNVNFNIGNNSPLCNQRPGNAYPQNHQQLTDQSNNARRLLISGITNRDGDNYRSTIVDGLFVFQDTYINTSHELIIRSDINIDDYKILINNHYRVSEYAGQTSYSNDDGSVIDCEIINRKEKYPPICTIVDIDNIDDKKKIDELLIVCYKICKKFNHDRFFLIFETSGSLEPGEPFTSSFDKTKGLFKKEVYSIRIL